MKGMVFNMAKEKANKNVKEVSKKGKEVNKKNKDTNKKGKGDNMKNKEINNKNSKDAKTTNVEVVDSFNVEDEFDMLNKQMEASKEQEVKKEEVNVGDVLDDMQKNIQSQMNEKMQKELDALKEQILKEKQREMDEFKTKFSEETQSIVDTLLKSIEEQTKINDKLKEENDKLKNEFNKTMEDVKAATSKKPNNEKVIEVESFKDVEIDKEEKKPEDSKVIKVNFDRVSYEEEEQLTCKYIRYIENNKRNFLIKIARALDVNEYQVQRLFESIVNPDDFWMTKSLFSILTTISNIADDELAFIYDRLTIDLNLRKGVSREIVDALKELRMGEDIDKVKGKYLERVCILNGIDKDRLDFNLKVLRMFANIMETVLNSEVKESEVVTHTEISIPIDGKTLTEIKNHTTIAAATVNYAFIKLKNKLTRMF